jgi:hypothetical protein
MADAIATHWSLAGAAAAASYGIFPYCSSEESVCGEYALFQSGYFTDAEADVADHRFSDPLVDPLDDLPLHELELLHPS